MTDLLKDLEAVALLAEKATPGEWLYRQGTAIVILGQGAGGFDLSACPQPAENAQAIAPAVNFIRAHHAEIAEAVKRLESAERDAATLRKVKAVRDEWARDAREHLNTFGQHLPASVECLVEQFDAATQEGEG